MNDFKINSDNDPSDQVVDLNGDMFNVDDVKDSRMDRSFPDRDDEDQGGRGERDNNDDRWSDVWENDKKEDRKLDREPFKHPEYTGSQDKEGKVINAKDRPFPAHYSEGEPYLDEGSEYLEPDPSRIDTQPFKREKR